MKTNRSIVIEKNYKNIIFFWVTVRGKKLYFVEHLNQVKQS